MRQRQEVQEVLPPLRIFPALPTESAVRKLPYRPARAAAPQIHGPHDAYREIGMLGHAVLRFRLGGPGLGLNGRSSPAAAKRCAGGAGLDGTDEPQAILNRPESNSL